MLHYQPHNTVILPSLPEDKTYKAYDMKCFHAAQSSNAENCIYKNFMQHLQCVPNTQMEIKVLSAIQFTADLMELSDAFIAKTLVEHGLRAPRRSFPASYLHHVDRTLMRAGHRLGGPSVSSVALRDFWNDIGEDVFASFRYGYDYRKEPAFAECC